jgi:dTDP-4-dehydrorhamnose 3,5-epimerase
MERLAENGVNPDVVDDQFGRLTFTTELSRAIVHLLEQDAPCGTYNVTNSGDVVSWFDIAREVFTLKDYDADRVTPISAAQFAERNETAERPIAPRPRNSALNLDKLRSTGFVSADWRNALAEFLDAN